MSGTKNTLKRKAALIIFSILSFLFILYSGSIYLRPVMNKKPIGAEDRMALEGQLVWQKNNCQTCHQLYGLGGYLGPDLTNIISTPGKGEPYVQAMLKAGTKLMPAYHLSDVETQQILAFLKSVDKTGKSHPHNFTILPTGQITQN